MNLHYIDISERSARPSWSFRKDLLKYFLVGTAPIPPKVLAIIPMYEEMKREGFPILNTIERSYEEFMEKKARLSRKESRKKREEHKT